LNQLPGPSSNKIYTDIGATRSSVVLRFVLIGKPRAVIHLGSNVSPKLSSTGLQILILVTVCHGFHSLQKK